MQISILRDGKKENNVDIKQWAEKQKNEMIKSIRFYISEGIAKNIAIEMVLKDSTVGSGIKAQIRYEFKYI